MAEGGLASELENGRGEHCKWTGKLGTSFTIGQESGRDKDVKTDK